LVSSCIVHYPQKPKIDIVKIEKLHHIAIICSDYNRSKKFYTDILGFTIDKEIYREERQSYKLDLSLNGQYLIELFSFPDPPSRPSRPEATGLRHIAFGVKDINEAIEYLNLKEVIAEEVRIDEFTNKKFTFIADPDNLPIEFYEV
jgi:glyoxylase I family protein